MTDNSPELQSALEQLLFKQGRARWERLEQLLAQASDTRDYEATEAVDKLLTYLLSPKAANIRSQLIRDLIDGTDKLGDETLAVLSTAIAQQRMPTPQELSTSPRLSAFAKIATSLSKTRNVDPQKILPIVQRLANEPVSRQAGIDIAAAISERAVTRAIRSAFSLPGVAA